MRKSLLGTYIKIIIAVLIIVALIYGAIKFLYNEYDKCQHDASEYLRYYALFIFSSRNEC